MVRTVALLFLHWLGDFVLQTRWMADNKSKNWEALTLHVFVYSFTVFCIGITGQYLINDLCRFATINFIIHFVVDSFTSRFTKKALEAKNMHLFFAIIGFDQFLHTSTLLIIAELLL